MLRDSLAIRLKTTDEPALGAATNEPDMIELMAHMGFDWVLLDQMFSGNDWSKTELLIRTAESAGITPIVRIQSNPWMGYDSRLAVDFVRAQGIGAKYIFVSNSGKKEIDLCAKVTHDWHRKAGHIHPFNSFDEWESKIEGMGEHTYVIPQPESVQALNEWEETLAIPEVRMFFFAMTDASRVLTKSDRPDWYAKELWDLVDRAVKVGGKKKAIIGGNTSYCYDMAEMHKRTVKLHEHGVRIILLQTAPFLFQLSVGKFLGDLRSALAVPKARGPK